MAQKGKGDFEVSCVFCPQKFKSLTSYNKHYNKMHSHEEHPETTLYCVACGYAYKRQGHLMNHMRLQHPTFDYKPTSTAMSAASFVRVKAPNLDDQVPSASNEDNEEKEATVVTEDRPIAEKDEQDNTNGTACSTRDSLTDSVKQCVASQLRKIKSMEALLEERRKEVKEIEKNIADHKAIVTALESDLPR